MAGSTPDSPDDPLERISPADFLSEHVHEFEMHVRAIAEELQHAGGTFIMRAFDSEEGPPKAGTWTW